MSRSVVVLPAPGRPEQHDEFAVGDAQVEVGDRLVLAERLG